MMKWYNQQKGWFLWQGAVATPLPPGGNFWVNDNSDQIINNNNVKLYFQGDTNNLLLDNSDNFITTNNGDFLTDNG